MATRQAVSRRAADGARPRKLWEKLGTLAAVSVTALAFLVTPAGAAADRSTRPVIGLADFGVVGSSTLLRRDRGVSATLQTTALTAGHVVTLWWVVFNNPAACVHGIPGLSLCGPLDEQNAAALPSILPAAGRIVGEGGRAHYGAHLEVGDTSGALLGPGLVDAQQAEIILVLRSHGPRIPELLREMLRTFGAGCKDAPPGTGTPGPNECREVQVSVHSPAEEG